MNVSFRRARVAGARGAGSIRWRRVALAVGAAPAVAALALAAGAVPPAAAFDGPNGHHQFVLIDTDGAPLWYAQMWLYDKNDKQVYYWSRPSNGWASGGKAVWWYTAVDGGRIHLRVDSVDYPGDMLGNAELDTWIKATDDPGHCAKINPAGWIMGWDPYTLSWRDDIDPSLQPSRYGCTPD